VVFGAALLVGLGALAYTGSRAGLQVAATAELLSTAFEKQSALERWFTEAQIDIAAQAASPVVVEQAVILLSAAPGSPEALAVHERLIDEFQPIIGPEKAFTDLLFIEAETGEVLAATDPGEEGKFKENLSYFIQGKRELYVSEMYYSVTLGRPAMTAAAPVIAEDGRLLGVLAGRLDLDVMNTIINRRTGLRQTDDAFLTNAIGLLVTQPRFISDPGILQQTLKTEAVMRCIGGNSGVISADDYRGVTALISYRWLPERQVCLIVKIDQAEAFASSQSFGRTVTWISGLALVIAIALTIVLARIYTRPIRVLQTGVKRLGQGELDYCVAVKSNDEIGHQAAAFNEMVTSLEKQRTERKQAEEELRDSEEHLRFLVEGVRDYAIFMLDTAGRIVSWNPGAERITGYRAAEIIGQHFSYFFLADDVKRGKPEQELAIAMQEGHYQEEGWQVRKDGSQFMADVVTTALFDETGELRGFSNLTRDITERKQAEQALRHSHDLLDLTGQLSRVGGWELDVETQTLIWTEEVYRIHEVDPTTQLNVAEAINFYAPEARPAITAAIQAGIDSGTPWDLELPLITAQGQRIWVRAQGAAERQGGRTVRLYGAMQDVTERKRADEELRKNAERAAMLAEFSQNLAEVTGDSQATLDLVARRVTELIGDTTIIHLVSKDGLYLDPVANYHPDPASLEHIRELYASVRHGVNEGFAPRIFQTQQALLLPSITMEQIRATIEPRLWPLLDLHSVHSLIIAPLCSQGRITGLLSVMRTQPDNPYTPEDRDFLQDLVDRAALALSNARLFSDLQAYAAKLEQSNRDLQEFAYVASHDLQEPLRKVQAFSDRLAQKYGDALDETGRDYLKRMHDASQRMQTLLSDLLEFSRVASRAQSFTTVDLHAVVLDVISDLETRLVKTGGQVEVGELPTIEADPTQMYQLLQNLVGNALKFRHEERAPMIYVSGKTNGAECRIIVKDNGIGFDPQYLDRIFKPFQRLHNRQEYEGSGIGLAICRRIVERHSGSITATSTPREGSTFIVTLPIHQSKGDSSHV